MGPLIPSAHPPCLDILCQKFLALSLRSFFCLTTLSYLFQIISVTVWEKLKYCFTCLYFWDLCLHFLSVSYYYIYSMEEEVSGFSSEN